MSRVALALTLLVCLILITAGGLSGVARAAGTAQCTADPVSAELGTLIRITCSGFDPNVLLNSYIAEDNGFSEVGRSNYAACLVGTRYNPDYMGVSKTDEAGNATYLWYTQDGTGSCPNENYLGYANQVGGYSVVIQQLDGHGGLAHSAMVHVSLYGPAETYSGASLTITDPVTSGGSFTVSGTGFVPGEMVNLWFTRPANCSGLGDWYWTGVSAFSPSSWEGGGISGPSAIKADASGSWTVTYLASDGFNAYPCLGQWMVTARALVSGRAGEASFSVQGKSIAENARVWVAETSVPSTGGQFNCYTSSCGIGVHVYGSGFPAGGVVNCWLTRPDGVVATGFVPGDLYGHSATFKVDAGGNFAGSVTTYSAESGYQGEQPGQWAVSCGTPDSKYSGSATFNVYGLPFIDP